MTPAATVTPIRAPAGTTAVGMAMDLPMNLLRFGHDPLAGPDINSRSTGQLDDIDRMEGMLREQGQLYRLLVVENPAGKKDSAGLYFVFDGNRRLAALRRIHGADAPVLIPCEVFPDAARALEFSLAANTTLPMHPVDRYRAYSEVARREKLKPADLAKRYGLPLRSIEQALALGHLADAVLDAWVAGKINAEAAEVLTLAADKGEQERVLKAALKVGGYKLEPENLRHAIMGKKKEIAHLVNYVGAEAYQKAGGKLTRDLFTEKHIVHNPEIATKLAAASLGGVARAIVADGWAWCETEDAMPAHWRHSSEWGRLPTPKTPKMTDEEHAERTRLERVLGEARAASDANVYDDGAALDAAREAMENFESRLQLRAFGPELRKKAGVVISIGEDGTLKAVAGVTRPAEKKAAAVVAKKEKAKAAAKGEVQPASLSQTHAVEISRVLTLAASDVVTGGEQLIVLRLVHAALASNGDGPIRISHAGLFSDEVGGADPAEFGQALAQAAKLDAAKLVAGISRYLGAAINLSNANGERRLDDKGDEPDVTALVNFLPQGPLQVRLRSHFDAEDFFDKAPGAFAKQALAEMAAPFKEGAKKGDLAKAAAEAATSRGWLPIALRTAGYQGPKAAAKPAAKTKAPAKKKGGRK